MANILKNTSVSTPLMLLASMKNNNGERAQKIVEVKINRPESRCIMFNHLRIILVNLYVIHAKVRMSA